MSSLIGISFILTDTKYALERGVFNQQPQGVQELKAFKSEAIYVQGDHITYVQVYRVEAMISP